MYTKHTWVKDELITADKLNNIENGISSAVSSGELAIGGFQNGDILTLSTADGKIRKMKYAEVEVGIQPINSETPAEGPEDLPDLIGSEEDLINLQKLFDLNSFTLFRGIGYTETGILHFNYVIVDNKDGITFFVCSGIAVDVEMYAYIFSNNKGWYSMKNSDSTEPLQIICKGFIPVEE